MRHTGLVLLLALALPLVAFERQPNADYRARRDKLAAKIGNGALLLFAGTEAEGQNSLRGFRQNDEFFYLTGIREPGGALLIAPATKDRPAADILFLPAHNTSQEKWTGPKLAGDDPKAAELTGFDRVAVLDRMRDEIARLFPGAEATLYAIRNDETKGPLGWLARANAFPNYTSWRNAAAPIGELRVVKDAGEIALIRKATDATVEAHRAAMKSAKPGMSENTLSAIMQYEFQKRGCEGPSYAPIVGSGFNSTVLHYSENSGTLKAGEVVVLDVGSEYSGYATDVTRTLPVSGTFTPRQREIYHIVLGAQQAAIAAFKAGTSTLSRTAPNTLYTVAYDYIDSHGKDLHGGSLGPYFIHGLGHYVGLSVHDTGDTSQPIPPGAVFTIEPGIYIPEENLGVRIEDTFYVRPDGTLDCLSCGVPKNAQEVEKMMRATAR